MTNINIGSTKKQRDDRRARAEQLLRTPFDHTQRRQLIDDVLASSRALDLAEVILRAVVRRVEELEVELARRVEELEAELARRVIPASERTQPQLAICVDGETTHKDVAA